MQTIFYIAVPIFLLTLVVILLYRTICGSSAASSDCKAVAEITVNATPATLTEEIDTFLEHVPGALGEMILRHTNLACARYLADRPDIEVDYSKYLPMYIVQIDGCLEVVLESDGCLSVWMAATPSVEVAVVASTHTFWELYRNVHLAMAYTNEPTNVLVCNGIDEFVSKSLVMSCEAFMATKSAIAESLITHDGENKELSKHIGDTTRIVAKCGTLQDLKKAFDI